MGDSVLIKNGKSVGVLCTRGLPKRKACRYCSRTHEFLCDYPVSQFKSGKKKGEWRTCDERLCLRHARKAISADVHFCRRHYALALEAYKRRLARAKKI
ncbi:MAG: hypothetical protein WA584_23530 [Pyrinomonadaceae bacterium]